MILFYFGCIFYFSFKITLSIYFQYLTSDNKEVNTEKRENKRPNEKGEREKKVTDKGKKKIYIANVKMK